MADASTLFDAVKSMRVVPIGKTAIAKVLIPLAIPMVIVAALQVPVGELLMKVIKTVL